MGSDFMKYTMTGARKLETCGIIPQLPCAFYDVCDFISNLATICRWQEIVRQKNNNEQTNKQRKKNKDVQTYVWYEQGLT